MADGKPHARSVCSAFRTIDDCTGIIADGQAEPTAAVTIGGGLLGLEAARGLMNHGCEVARGAYLAGLSDGRAARRDRCGDPEDRPWRAWASRSILEITRPRSSAATDRVTGLAFKDGTDARLRHGRGVSRHPTECRDRHARGLTVERAIVVDNHMRSVDDMNVYVVGECAQHRGKVYGLVAPLWEQAKVFADHITKRPTRDAAYHGSKLATKLKVMGVELASMGITEPKPTTATR